MGQGIIVLMSGSGGDGAMSILYDNSYNKFKYILGIFYILLGNTSLAHNKRIIC